MERDNHNGDEAKRIRTKVVFFVWILPILSLLLLVGITLIGVYFILEQDSSISPTQIRIFATILIVVTVLFSVSCVLRHYYSVRYTQIPIWRWIASGFESELNLPWKTRKTRDSQLFMADDSSQKTVNAPNNTTHKQNVTRIKRVILGIAAALTLLIFFSIVAIFNICDNESSFQFLNQYEVEQRSSWASKTHISENITYRINADYDTFIESAKAELLAKGFIDKTDPNKPYKQVYEKDAFEDVQIEIYFAVVRSGLALNKPLYGPLDIKVHRIKPKLSIKNLWNYLKREYMKIKFKVKYHRP